jgi:hypothetical protein
MPHGALVRAPSEFARHQMSNSPFIVMSAYGVDCIEAHGTTEED